VKQKIKGFVEIRWENFSAITERTAIHPYRFPKRYTELGFRSQAEVARSAGVHPVTLSRYLTQGKDIRPWHLRRLATVLQCSTKWLIVISTSFPWQSVKEMHDTPSKYPSVEWFQLAPS
jgi:hypothetical protein